MSEIDWNSYLPDTIMSKHPDSEIFSEKVNSILSAGCIYTFCAWVLAVLTIVIIARML